MTVERLIRDLVECVWNGGRTDELGRFFADKFDHGGRADLSTSPRSPSWSSRGAKRDALVSTVVG
ncbi:hypothetical protein [Micromonospora sp. DT47]|uniref:hypothetical protein n=1 Tax=Micromonospora sp. DT47 TaxID=3393431 RepID=UPI003CF31E67